MLYYFDGVNPDTLPQQFTNPYHYTPHPLCKKACTSLQEQLARWGWDSECDGKMFGVLIVSDQNKRVGYLYAYSGNLRSNLPAEAFVPPIYNIQDQEGFFRKGEQELDQINSSIKDLENSPEIEQAKSNLSEANKNFTTELAFAKEHYKRAKRERDILRKSQEAVTNPKLLEQLIAASQKEKADLKRLKQRLQQEIETQQAALEVLLSKITALKTLRRNKSAALQDKLFQQYQLLNAFGEQRDLKTIFDAINGSTPPAAAGDCAAPRLLQYAYQNKLKPLAMAEFWWGKSPNTLVRKQGSFYPSCKSKCEPILSHMLQGLDIQKPIKKPLASLHIEIVHEDDEMVVINKPSGMLSAPGKSGEPDVLDVLKKMDSGYSNLILVHRLDRDTSGILMLAKNQAAYLALQKQFINREVKKRYEAVLDGELTADYGKIELPLRADFDNRPQQMVCEKQGKPALTIWKKIADIDHKTRVSFYPITGRTHQLRVHSAHVNGLNSPILGDNLYGEANTRLHLHAAAIEFKHPKTMKALKLNCKVPF